MISSLLLARRYSSTAATRRTGDGERRPRQLAFKAISRIAELCQARRYLDALHLIFGPAASVQRIFSPSQIARIKSIGSGSVGGGVKPFPPATTRRPEVWNAMIDQMARRGLVDESFAIYYRMKERQLPASPETFTSLFTACSVRLADISSSSSSGSAQAAEAVYHKAGVLFYKLLASTSASPSSSSSQLLSIVHVNSYLKVCSRAGQWAEMFDIYRRLCRPGSGLRAHVGLDVDGFLARYRASNATDSPDNSLADRDGLARLFPDTRTYTSMISACAQRGGEAAWRDALMVWRDVQSDVLRSSSVSVSAIGRGGGDRAEEEILNELHRGEPRPIKSRDDALSQEEYSAWLEFDKRFKSISVPDICVDTEMVNALLMACKSSNRFRSNVYAFMLFQEFFGAQMDWFSFIAAASSIDDCPAVKAISKELRRLNTRAGVEEQSESACGPLLLPNAKTLAIVMNAMVGKMKASPLVVSRFYDYYTRQLPPHLRVIPDMSVQIFHLQILADAGEHGLVLSHIQAMTSAHDKKMKRAHQKSTLPETVYEMKLYALIAVRDSQENIDKAWLDIVDMARRNLRVDETSRDFRPSLRCVSTYIDALNESKRYEDALRVVDDFIHQQEADGWQNRVVGSRRDKLLKLGMSAALGLKGNTSNATYRKYLDQLAARSHSKERKEK